MLPQKVSCTCLQGFMVKYYLSANRGGDFTDELQGLDLARQKTCEVPLQHNSIYTSPSMQRKER